MRARTTGVAPCVRVLTAACPRSGYFAPQVLGCMFGARGDGSGGYDGAKADVWSAGALLSELLLKRLPYDFVAFEMEMAPNGTLRQLWERARSASWRESAAASGRPLDSISASVLSLLDGMLHPRERERMSLDDVAAHAWVRQPLDAAHEAALAELATRQLELKRQRRKSGVYCRSDGDGIIAALVSRASASAQRQPGDKGTTECIRLRLEDVPRLQCPPSLVGVPPQGGHTSLVAPSPRKPPQTQRAPPSPSSLFRPRTLAVAAVGDDDHGDGSVRKGVMSMMLAGRSGRDEHTV